MCRINHQFCYRKSSLSFTSPPSFRIIRGVQTISSPFYRCRALVSGLLIVILTC